MVRFMILLAMTAALLGACSTYHDRSRELLQTLPHHYRQFDLQVAWEARVVGGETLVDGAVKNVRYPFMYDLELWVAVLDAGGKVVTRSVSYVIPRQLDLDESAEFSLKLPVAAAAGTKLRFTYRYRGSEGGDRRKLGADGTPWTQSFDAALPAAR